jgi:uncharacterized protein
VQYSFDWDPNKAKLNISKHNVSFEQAVTVFRDPKALTVFDSNHSDNEDRWITLGISANGNILVICHTFKETDKNNVLIRIISVRKSTKKEQSQYIGGDIL